jgi:hypothetical protein
MRRPPRPERLARPAALLGGLALLACLGLGFHAPRSVLLAYLAAWLFWLGLALGSSALVCVHALTGGEWGLLLRPCLLAAQRSLPLLALLFLPVILGVHVLYPWAHAAAGDTAGAIPLPRWWLNPAGFVLRAVAFLAAWIALAFALARPARAQPDAPVRAGLAAAGLIVLGVGMTLAAIDWIMSLVPGWHSTVFGLAVAAGQTLGACALAVLGVALTSRTTPAPPPRLCADLGNLLLVLLLFWAYLVFMDYLTAWTGDLPVEVRWYLPRTGPGWRWLAWFVIAPGFALPFCLLLSRWAKARCRVLGAIAVMVLLAQFAFMEWLIVPGQGARGGVLAAAGALALAGIGLPWLVVFAGAVRAGTAGWRAREGTQVQHV